MNLPLDGLLRRVWWCGNSRWYAARRATKAIEEPDPKANVGIDLASHRVRVEPAEDLETVESAVTEAGYAPS